MKNSLSSYKMQELQTDVNSLLNDIKTIKENELPHLKEQITALSIQVKLLGTLNIIGILSILAISRILS